MKTDESRVAALHARMKTRRYMQERRKTVGFGVGSGGLAICLLLVLFKWGGMHASKLAGPYCGTTMLFDKAGGYVLTAVIAFIVGMLITMLCIRSRRK